MEVSTLSGVVIDSGIGVVIFILGDLAKPAVVWLAVIITARADINKLFVFILFSFLI
jgi:hypothetical protein